MKKSILLLTVLLCFLLFCGCAAPEISSNDLIYAPEMIDRVSVGVIVGTGEAVNVDIKAEGEVNEMLDLLKNIEIEELPLDQVQEIFKNAEIWSQKVKYQITLITDSKFDQDDSSAAVKGFVLVLEEGNLLFVDPLTMGPFEDDQMEKTVYYISKRKQTENISRMVRIIEKTKEYMNIFSGCDDENSVWGNPIEPAQAEAHPDSYIGNTTTSGSQTRKTIDASDPEEATIAKNELQGEGQTAIPSIDEVEDAYNKATEAFYWFYVTTMPVESFDRSDSSTYKEIDGMIYHRVTHNAIKTCADLENYLRSLFADEIATELLDCEGVHPRYRDIDGALYAIIADRGTNIYKGEAALEVTQESDVKFICTVRVELLDENFFVTEYETHEYSYEFIDGQWVFTSFYLFR